MILHPMPVELQEMTTVVRQEDSALGGGKRQHVEAWQLHYHRKWDVSFA